ncbi:MAG: D-2-hydroxyacid dehydrogenase [Planctomycetes bacterium]|nr:D-2-hydroxyacid dehydrogenase [Planctomycetota bacterium]
MRRTIVLGLLCALACRTAEPARDSRSAPAASTSAVLASDAERLTDALAIGSERGARIALDTQGGKRELLYLAGDVSEDEQDRLYQLAPNVRVLAKLSREDALKWADQADGCDAQFLSPEFLAKAKKLRYVQARSAGVDRYAGMQELRARSEIVLCNLRAVHGPAIADHVFAMLLALARDLPSAWERQRAGEWRRDGAREPFSLAGRTLLVVGLGGIGTEVARRAKGFEMRVLATRRSGTDAPSFVDRVELADRLGELLPLADVIVLCVPLTPETTNLIDARAFAALKPGAILVNIARGKVVDTPALVEALKSGRLGGACLDVTEPEPLPQDHELWRLANVLITPHVAASASLTDDRATALLRENLRRFARGEPLLNVVDWNAGY